MKTSLNLASRRYVNRRALHQIVLFVILLLLVLLTFQLRGYLQGHEQAKEQTKDILKLQQEYQQLLGKAPPVFTSGEVERQNLEFGQAQALLQRDAFRWTALFDRLEKRLPDGVSITSFNPDYAGRKLALSGLARDLSALRAMLNSLHKGAYAQVFLKSQSQVKVKDAQGEEMIALSFQVTLEGVF